MSKKVLIISSSFSWSNNKKSYVSNLKTAELEIEKNKAYEKAYTVGRSIK